jgi:hypothetical protein
MNLLQEIVIQIERKKMLKSLDYKSDGTVYDGEVEALYQTLGTLLKQPGGSETNKGV